MLSASCVIVYSPLSPAFDVNVGSTCDAIPVTLVDTFSSIVIGLSTPTTFTLNLYVSLFVSFVVVVSFFIGNI